MVMKDFRGGQVQVQAKKIQSRIFLLVFSRFWRTRAWFDEVAVLRGSRTFHRILII